MKTAGIIVDNWKLPIFKSNLDEHGYSYKEEAFTKDTVILKVEVHKIAHITPLVHRMNRLAADYRLLHPDEDYS